MFYLSQANFLSDYQLYLDMFRIEHLSFIKILSAMQLMTISINELSESCFRIARELHANFIYKNDQQGHFCT